MPHPPHPKGKKKKKKIKINGHGLDLWSCFYFIYLLFVRFFFKFLPLMPNKYFTRQLILNKALGGTIWDFFLFYPKLIRVLLRATKVAIKHKDPFSQRTNIYLGERPNPTAGIRRRPKYVAGCTL